MTPFTTSVAIDGDLVVVTAMLTTDMEPPREFRPFLDIVLDEPNAIMLFGELGLALQSLSEARASSTVVPFPGARK